MSNYICVDFHVHTALSPCANNEMTPTAIIREAKKSGLDAIAITDHNSAKNVEAVMEAGKKQGVTVIPGMEVETLEEVHVLTLFDNMKSLLIWEKIVEEALPQYPNDPSLFGQQLVLGADDEILVEYSNLLVQSTKIPLEKVVQQVVRLGGVSIPSHVTRTANGLISVLGFIPPELNLTTIEYDRKSYNLSNIDEKLFSHYNIIVNSDAHSLVELYGTPSTALKVTTCNPKNIVSRLKEKSLNNEVVVVQ